MNVLLTGPYGGFNLGDDLIMRQIVDELRRLDCAVTVTSARPAATSRIENVSAVPYLDLKRGRIQLLWNLHPFDWIIIGGGQQVQESRFGNPLWGLLPSVAYLARAAKLQRKKVMLWGVGVEPINTKIGKILVRWLLSNADVVTVRDHDSYARLLPYVQDESKMLLAADPVFALKPLPTDEAVERSTKLLGYSPAEIPTIVLTPANDRRSSVSYITPLVDACKKVAREIGGRVVVILMDRQVRYDQALVEHPALQDDETLTLYNPESLSVDDVIAIHAASAAVVGARMHSLIIGYTQQRPVVNVSRGPKMTALSDIFGDKNEHLDTNSLTMDRAFNALTKAFGTSVARTNVVTEDLRERASLSTSVFQEQARIGEK